MSNPTIALIIDCSGSMNYYGYLPYAKTDACTFVNIMQNNDSCSVVKFETTATVVQATIGLAGQATKDNICALIQGIPAGNTTDMGDAIILATAQIGSAPSPRGMVLLSDGVWNTGPNPINNLPSNIPIYTIALGNYGQLALMQQIATATGGQYNYAPGFRQLAQIYNTIVAQALVARTLTNDLDSVNTNFYRQVPTIISAATASGTFTVNWDNAAVVYTPNTPVGNQMNITLIDPNNVVYTSPVFNSGPCVVFNIINPVAGTWNVGCWYAGPAGGVPLNCVWGTFAPAGSTQLDAALVSSLVQAGTPAVATVQFLENGKPMLQSKISVKVDAPVEDHSSVQKKYKADLQIIKPDPTLTADGYDENMAKIITLAKNKGTDLYPRSVYPCMAVKKDGETHHITVNDTAIRGGYNVHVVASGISPTTGSPVQETRILSFLSA